MVARWDLFSSMRAAVEAAEAMREQVNVPILSPGGRRHRVSWCDSSLPSRRRVFLARCRCGRGSTSPELRVSLSVVDRIPFPRPDDPLMSARQKAVADAGGNGFMAVAAAQAALLLAQGTGRLLRSRTDRGVVAVLDSRLATARYAGFLRASLPPFWFTTDPTVVRNSLRALNQAAGGRRKPAVVDQLTLDDVAPVSTTS